MALPSVTPVDLSFDILRTVLTIHEAGSVTGAADRLQRAQSTVSYALNCARAAFHDELFVREGNHMVPTPRCVELVPRLRAMVQEIQTLALPEHFDPAKDSAEITISCNQYEQTVFLAPLVAHARSYAPSLTLKFLRSHTQGQEQLLSGACDILISPVMCDRLDVYGTALFSDSYVCVSDARNALPAEGLSLADYLNRNHVSITYGGSWRPFFSDMLPEAGRAMNTPVQLCSATDLFEVLRGTDLVATIPSRATEGLGPEFTVTASPFDTRLDTYLFYTKRIKDNPAATWVRTVLLNIARTQPPLSAFRK